MKTQTNNSSSGTELKVLKDILITQLLLASVGQAETAKIAKVDIHRVSEIGKLLKRGAKERKR